MVTWFPLFQHLYDIFGAAGSSNCCQGEDSTLGGLLYSNGMTGPGVRRWGLKAWFFFSWQNYNRSLGAKGTN